MVVTEDPLVSVIVPTRDRPGLVERAVESVLRQSYPRLEVFVVDDGSEIPVELPRRLLDDERLMAIRLDRSVGSGPARDHAIALAAGELLAFCDDDDEWIPSKTREQVDVMVGHPDVVAVESGYEMWNGDRLSYRYLPARRDAFRTLLERPIMAPTVVMTRKASVLEAGGFGSLERHHDWDLWLRMTPKRRVVGLPRIHALRRDHPPLSFDVQLDQHRALLETRIIPAMDGLPPAERARILGFHYRVMGMLAARAGDPPRARALLVDAWRERPSDVGSLARLGRTFLDERRWQVLAGQASRVRGVVVRTAGRDPYLRSF